MSWDIAVAGTLHLDEITTPHGRHTSLGGSALYFALAAARHTVVHVHGIVGADHADEFARALRHPRLRLHGVVTSDAPTFVWHARHDFQRWVACDTSAEEGCDPLWPANLSKAGAAAPVLFLASMRPSLQLVAIQQSRARMVGADSMAEYTEGQRDRVQSVVRSSDLLFATRDELASLTRQPAHRWRQSARALCGDGRLGAVIVKAGPEGAACITGERILDRRPLAGATVVDPTGAGDALAGGFLGFCAAAERDDEGVFSEALDAGMGCAAVAISGFGPIGLLDVGAG